MGRKRKAQKGGVMGKEDNAWSETAGDEKICSHTHTHNNPNIIDAINTEDMVPAYSSGLPPKEMNSKATNVVIRRSTRLKSSASLNGRQVDPVVENVNLVNAERGEAPNHQQVRTLPVSDKNQRLKAAPVMFGGNLEQKADYNVQAVDEFLSEDNAFSETTRKEKIQSHIHHNPNYMDATNIENIVPLYSSSSPPEKINSKVTNVVVRRSDRLRSSVLHNGRQQVEPVVKNINLVGREREEAPDHQQVRALLVSERNLGENAKQNQKLKSVSEVSRRNLKQQDDYISAVDEFKSKDNACSEPTGTEKICSHAHQNPNATDALNLENMALSYSDSLPPKTTSSEFPGVVIRRSDHLRNRELHNGRQQVEPVGENVIPVEREKGAALDQQPVGTLPDSERNLEEEATQNELLKTVPEVFSRNLEQKVDYFIQVVDVFNSKNFKQATRRPNEGPSTDFSYRSLYIDSQKKIEALIDKYDELVRELEFARGKIDVYEKMNYAMGASKEAILASSLEEDAEAVILSPQRVKGCLSAAASGSDEQDAFPKRTSNNSKK